MSCVNANERRRFGASKARRVGDRSVYRPKTELFSHYFEAVLPEQFDALVWFEEIQAMTPLAVAATNGAADTYPSGF